ncbi:single-stranded DNA-binding protein [Coraliomargarita sinensis]|uniref:Single-stranded DNA-binding protein n=2 Tax=Coraliomargarita sinensis TaxID=2174842 RepID=A0A317ZLK3_9BACT|nr:single-stranded DNA-binding protein [Coraliomargarita sinensis]
MNQNTKIKQNMSSYNQCTFVGNLTADPELRKIGDKATPVLDGSLAVNRVYKDKEGRKVEDVDFIPFTSFGKAAEILAKYLRKGDSVLLSGEMRQDKWEDKESGQKRSQLKLRVENFTLLNNKRD